MSLTGPGGLEALEALLAGRAGLAALTDKDWSAAAAVIVKRMMISKHQTRDKLIALRTAAGDDIFEPQLKSLTHHQAKLLARRLDAAVSDFDVSTAAAAIAHVRGLLADPPRADEPATEAMPAGETVAEIEAAGTEAAETTPSANPYFGRKSFRTD
jgi:hypothetical protein